MKFLDDIEDLKRATADLLAAKDDLQKTMDEASEQLRLVREAIAHAPTARTFHIQLSNGIEFDVSEHDALLMVAALCTNLDMKEVSITLESGQTIDLSLTDMEQACLLILAAAKPAAGAGLGDPVIAADDDNSEAQP